MNQRVRSIFLIIASALLVSTSNAQFSFRSTMDGVQSGTNVPGTGTAYGTFSQDFKTLTYQVTIAHLTGPITGSHFHIAPSGSIVQPITFIGNTAIGTWSNIPDSLLRYFIKGKIYINVHTSAHPAGEIRGTLNPQQFLFTVNLNGTQAGTPSTGRGTGYVIWTDSTGAGVPNTLLYSVTIAGLNGNFTGSHFHVLPSGSIVHPIAFTDSTAIGSWSGYPDSIITLLLHGKVYVNVHSTVNPGGEIHGAVVPVGEVPFVAAIDGAQSGTNSLGKGTAYAVLTEDMASIRFSATYARLSAALSGSHFHTATNGGIIQPVTFTANSTFGDWIGFSDINLQDLFRGRVYMNLHTANFPAGEIRGTFKYYDGTFTTRLNGPNAGTTSTGTGTAWAHFGGTTDSSFYQVTFAGLADTYSGSHFHIAPAGSVVKPIVTPDSTTGSGGWAMADSLVVALLRNQIYVNIHSKTFPAGDIRGTMVFGSGAIAEVRQVSAVVPASYALEQNYPNPFNPSTTINFSLSKQGLVTLSIYNILGQRVAVLVNEIRPAGTYTATFDARDLASGMYIYRLTSGAGISLSKKMLLLK
jgi:hypothetical protein